MTLSDLLPAVQQLSAPDKRELLRLLAAELSDSTQISPFEPFKIYYFPTPYNTFGAGAILMQFMQQAPDPHAL